MDLRGASAEALAALTARLDDEIGTNRSAAALGDELFTVSRLFRTEPGLRRFATDASLAAETKQGMVQQVFADRLSETDARACSPTRWAGAGPSRATCRTCWSGSARSRSSARPGPRPVR